MLNYIRVRRVIAVFNGFAHFEKRHEDFDSMPLVSWMKLNNFAS